MHRESNEEDNGAGANIEEGEKRKKRNNKKKKKVTKQTEPPAVPVAKFFKDNIYPIIEKVDYKDDSSWRINSKEKCNLRKSAEVHHQVRSYAQKNIKPGMSMIEICDMIENDTRTLIEENVLEAGVGFLIGCSLNGVATHYTPNPGDKLCIQYQDACKIDFGVHINVHIVDSACIFAFGPRYDRLLAPVKDATNTGVTEADIDVKLCDISASIQKVMESYEIELNCKTYPIKLIRNLYGHNIGSYRIHYDKSIPAVKNNDETKMEEG